MCRAIEKIIWVVVGKKTNMASHKTKLQNIFVDGFYPCLSPQIKWFWSQVIAEMLTDVGICFPSRFSPQSFRNGVWTSDILPRANELDIGAESAQNWRKIEWRNQRTVSEGSVSQKLRKKFANGQKLHPLSISNIKSKHRNPFPCTFLDLDCCASTQTCDVTPSLQLSS